MTDQSKPNVPTLMNFADDIDIAARHLKNSLTAISASINGEITGDDEGVHTFLECAERFAADIFAIKDRMYQAYREQKGLGHGS